MIMKKINRVLHVVPDSVASPTQFYLGSTKDIRGRTEYFQHRGILFDEIQAKERSDKKLLADISQMDLNSYSVVFYETALYPRTMGFVRRKYPHLVQVTRSINADFYHWLDYVKANLKYPQALLSPKMILNSFRWLFAAFDRLFWGYVCAQYSDYMLSIVEWERNHYWKYLTDEKRVRNLPYFLPAIYQREVEQSDKKMQCVCLLSSTVGTVPFQRDLVSNFSTVIKRLGNDLPDWLFYVTGDISKLNLNVANRVQPTGFLDSPFPLLIESRAVALLSDFGFGFKTKLIDAIQSECYMLVPKKLYARLPREIQPYCIVVDINLADSFRQALEQSKAGYPQGAPNEVFKEQAFRVLDEIFLN